MSKVVLDTLELGIVIGEMTHCARKAANDASTVRDERTGSAS